MLNRANISASVVAAVALVAGALLVVPVQTARADSDTALGIVGGLMVGKMVSDNNKRRQEDAYREGQRDRYYAEQDRRYREEQQRRYYEQQQQQQRQQQASGGSVEDRLRKLKGLRDDGLISAEDYERRKAQILSDI